jgi:hypothetical protein
MHNNFVPLPNGAPRWRLRYLAKHLHELGPRMLLDLLEALVAGEFADAAAIVDRLEDCARLDPGFLQAIGGYHIPSQLFDLTWVIELERRAQEAETEAEPEREREEAAL